MEKKSGRLSWVAVLLVVALLCFGAYMLARQIVAGRSSALRTATPMPARAGQELLPMGNSLIYYDGTTLHALDEKGRQRWSYVAGSGAGFHVGEGGVSAWSGTMLSLLSDQGVPLYSGNMDDVILSARLGKTYAAVQIGTEHDSTILIMEQGGRQIDSIALTDQTVLDFGFFNNGNLLWAMSMNTEGTVPTCSVSTYKPGKMLLGSVYDSEQVIYEALFQSSKIRAVGTTHVKDYDYTGKEITANRILVYGWYLMDIDEEDDNPLMAFVPIDQADGSAGIQDVRMIRGQVDHGVRLPYASSSVYVKDDALYAFTNQYVMTCRMDENKVRTYALPIYAESVLGLTENHSAIVSSGGTIYLVPLP